MDELSTDVGAGPVELMAFQRSHDEHLDAFAPHTGSHQLHGKTLTRAAGAQNCDIGILVDSGIEDVHDDKRVVVLVHPQQNAVVIAHLIAGEGIAAHRTQGQHIAAGAFIEMFFQ